MCFSTISPAYPSKLTLICPLACATKCATYLFGIFTHLSIGPCANPGASSCTCTSQSTCAACLGTQQGGVSELDEVEQELAADMGRGGRGAKENGGSGI
eukprot:825867-Pelagomonas_calceolata.AAC.6